MLVPSPDVGSSKKRTSGSVTKPIPMFVLFACPPILRDRIASILKNSTRSIHKSYTNGDEKYSHAVNSDCFTKKKVYNFIKFSEQKTIFTTSIIAL